MASKARAFEEAMRKKREEEENAKNSELEAFKRQREADMRAKREAAKKESEENEVKEAKQAKKAAFKNKFAMFEKKEGPSEEEKIKTEITKASQNRRFEKQMKNMMAENSGKNPLAMEMALRSKIGNSKVKVENEGEQTFEGSGTAEYVEEEEEDAEEGAKKQSAFRMAQELAALKVVGGGADDGHVTEVVEEEGWGDLVKPIGETAGDEDPAMVVENWKEMDDENGKYYWNTVTNDTSYDEPACMVIARTGSEWQKVEDDGNGHPFYWNLRTNDTTYDPPPGFGGGGAEEGGEEGGGGGGGQEGETIMWTEYQEEGKVMYQHSEKPEITREDKPQGAVLVACEDGTMWTEQSDGSYINSETGEAKGEKPEGITMVAEVEGGGNWQVHHDEGGNEYYYNPISGTSTYEKPEGL